MVLTCFNINVIISFVIDAPKGNDGMWALLWSFPSSTREMIHPDDATVDHSMPLHLTLVSGQQTD